jgi:hypothetical protein
MFLASAVMALMSLRARTGRWSLELRAESVFIVALALLALVSTALAFEIT